MLDVTKGFVAKVEFYLPYTELNNCNIFVIIVAIVQQLMKIVLTILCINDG